MKKKRTGILLIAAVVATATVAGALDTRRFDDHRGQPCPDARQLQRRAGQGLHEVPALQRRGLCKRLPASRRTA